MRKATLESPPVFRLAGRDGPRLTLKSDTGAIAHVFVLEDDIVRLMMLPAGTLSHPRSWAIAPGAEDVADAGRDRFDMHGFTCPDFTPGEEPGRITIETDRLRLAITLHGFHCRWSIRVGDAWIEVLRDRRTQAYNFGWWDDVVAHHLQREPGEQYYGLGEKSGLLDRAGRRLRMRSTDAMGYDAETTDPLYKHIPFVIARRSDGICYGQFYDTLSDCTFDLGCEMSNYHGLFRSFTAVHGDLDMTFIAGPALSQVTERFTWLTGKPAATPDWALAYSGSTMQYTDAPDAQAKMRSFLDKLTEHGLACRSFHLSSGYTSIGSKRYVFHWNREKFPDPRGFLAEYNRAGVRVAANIKPVLLTDHPRYAEAAERGLFLARADGAPAVEQFWDAPGSYLDFTNPATLEWWKENVTHALLDLGVAATWNDNNEYEITSRETRAHGFGAAVAAGEQKPLQPLLMMRASRAAQMAKAPDQIPYVVSRSGMAGMQRYAQTWTGDNFTSWKTLKFNIRMGLGLALSGISNIGNDVGGFAGPAPDRELFLRWLGFGVFMPRFSIHSWNSDGTTTEPWMYSDAMDTVRALFALRTALIPEIADALADYRERYIPAIRPTFYDFPDDPQTWNDCDAFLLGRKILVAPVVEAGAVEKRVCLPGGTLWTDHWTGEIHQGGQAVVLPATFDKPPFLRRI